MAMQKDAEVWWVSALRHADGTKSNACHGFGRGDVPQMSFRGEAGTRNLDTRASGRSAEHLLPSAPVHAVSKSVTRITATALPLFVAPSILPVLQVQTKFFLAANGLPSCVT